MIDSRRWLALAAAVLALFLLAAAQMALAHSTLLDKNGVAASVQTGDGWPPLYRVGMVQDLSTTNYWAYLGRDTSDYNGYVLNTFVHSLFTLTDQRYDFVPRLAAGYGLGPVRSGDWWTITVPIKQGIYWSDGTPFTAADVVFTLQTCADPVLGLGGGWPQRCPDALDHVAASEGYTVTYFFTRSVGISTWAAEVALAPVLPKHYWEQIVEEAKNQPDPAAWLYDQAPDDEPVLGPFRLGTWVPGTYVDTVRNPRYYFQGLQVRHYANGAYSETLPGKYTFSDFAEPSGPVDLSFTVGPHVRGVHYIIYGSDAEAYQALRDGDIDYVLNPRRVYSDLRGPLDADPQVTTVRNQSYGMWYLAFNLRRMPMEIPEFRHAVATLVDREFPATFVTDLADPAYTFVPEGNRFWHNAAAPRIGEGLTRQERISDTVDLLVSAGFTWTVQPRWDEQEQRVVPGQGLSYDAQPVPPVELLAPNMGYDPIRATEALSIGQWLVEAGISVTVVLSDFDPIVDRVFNQVDFDTYILGWILGSPAFPSYLNNYYHSRYDALESAGFNAPGYHNALYDALADEFMSTPDRQRAQTLAYTMQVTLATDLPYVTLHTVEQFDAYRNDKVRFPYTLTLDGLEGQAGMPALVSPVAESVRVDPETGGSLTYTDSQGLPTTVQFPPGAVTETTTFAYSPRISPTVPLSPEVCFAGHAFDLEAYCTIEYRVYLPLLVRGFTPVAGLGQATEGTFRQLGLSEPPGAPAPPRHGALVPCNRAFAQPVTITVRYSEADVGCLSDEGSLLLYYWDGIRWGDAASTCTPNSPYHHDLNENSVAVAICHLTQYAIGGK